MTFSIESDGEWYAEVERHGPRRWRVTITNGVLVVGPYGHAYRVNGSRGRLERWVQRKLAKLNDPVELEQFVIRQDEQ